MEAKEFARQAAELTLSKKAQDVVIMDLTGLSDVTNFFVVCSGESDTQVKAIADAVMDGAVEIGVKVWRKEGLNNLQWVLLDFVDVVVHVFQPKVREYYDLERLWGDAPVTQVHDE
ncbi:ribosome silencing factor [bacterium]|nr:ribosome silencing factor [bacterium]